MTIPRRRSTGHEHADRLVAGGVALIAVLATPTGPLVAQEVIELPAEDRLLNADFEEVNRLGTLDTAATAWKPPSDRPDWEGTMWVRRRGDEGAGGDPTDLITADGRYLGTFAPGATALPEAFGPGGLLAFVETDDLDVPYVVVKRFRRPEGVPECSKM